MKRKNETDEERERRQRLARFYTRRERYQKAFLALGLREIYADVKKMEKMMGLKFDKRQFFEEVHNPDCCVNI